MQMKPTALQTKSIGFGHLSLDCKISWFPTFVFVSFVIVPTLTKEVKRNINDPRASGCHWHRNSYLIS